MTITEKDAGIILGLMSFADGKGELSVEDAELGLRLMEAFSHFKDDYPLLFEQMTSQRTPEAIERSYSIRLRNLIALNKNALTVEELAQRLGKSVEWVKAHTHG